MVGQCGDGPYGDGGQSLERKSRGQSRLEESCEGSQSPPRAVVLMMIMNFYVKDCSIHSICDDVQRKIIWLDTVTSTVANLHQ